MSSPPPVKPSTVLQPGMTRANPAMMAARMDEVVELIGKLYPTRKIIQVLTAKWGLTPSVVLSNYINPARKRMRDEYEAATPYAADRLRETLADLYDKAMATGDLKTAANVLRQLAAIDGANAPTSVTAQVAGNVEVALGPGNPEATRARMQELLARPEIRARLEAQGLTTGKK